MESRLRIADITWLIKYCDGMLDAGVLDFCDTFIGGPDIELNIELVDSIDIPGGMLINSEILEWYICSDGAYFLLKKDEVNNKPLIGMYVNQQWNHVRIHCTHQNESVMLFVNYLLMEIIFRNRIHFHDGFVLHASALELDKMSLAFTGKSGTGKTTHVHLWESHKGARVINDDHPAIRIIDGKVMVFGTPWAGEEKKYCNHKKELTGIVLLEQGLMNEVHEVKNMDIIHDFLPRAFLPHYSTEMMKIVLGLVNEVVKKIKIIKLVCRPDKESVEIVSHYFSQI